MKRAAAVLGALVMAVASFVGAGTTMANASPVWAAGGSGPAVSGGYWIAQTDGQNLAFGDATNFANQAPSALNAPIVGAARAAGGRGLWLLGADGGIFSVGDATFHGSTGGMTLNKPVVGMTATRDGGGYWLVAADGGIFSFGDARFFGSTGAMTLNQPVVGMTATRDGGGYWLVAADGGIFSFGDAPFFGSTGAIHLDAPIVGMASTPDGRGYWLVASDGGVFTFGDAKFFGSEGGKTLAAPIVGMAATPSGGGYWLQGADGTVFSFGNAQPLGNSAGLGYTAAAIVPQESLGRPLTTGTPFNATWSNHSARLTIGTDGRVAIDYRTFNFCGPTQTPGACDLLKGNFIFVGGGFAGRITSIKGDTAQTAVDYDPGGLASGHSTQMTYDPAMDVITYLGSPYCGTDAPANTCGA